jgi:ribokinase
MESRRICVLGSANADYFLYVNSIPVKGETIQAHKYMTANGGKGANQAVAAAKLNAPTTFLGQAGNDDAMHRLGAEMEKAKVQLSWKIL